MGKQIAVDICNTICDVNGILEKDFGFHKRPDVYEYPGLAADFFRQHTEIFLKAEVFRYAKECLNLLAESYEIIYLSARPANAHTATVEYLKKNRFPDGNVVFTNNKVEYFKEHKMLFAIDDAPTELERYLRNGIPVAAYMQPYNEHIPGYRFTWDGLYKEKGYLFMEELVIL